MGKINDRIKDLLIGYLNNDLTADENQELEDWAHASEENRNLFNELTDPAKLAENMREFYEAKQAISRKVNQSEAIDHPIINPSEIDILIPGAEVDTLLTSARSVSRPANRAWLYAAASIVLSLSIGSYFWWAHSHEPGIIRKGENVQPAKNNDVVPGSNKAILELADGSRILLDSSGSGMVARQGNITVMKPGDGQLAYMASANDNSTSVPALAYNTLTTPRGGQFRVSLSDGTKVWLNNASSLRYPAVFTGNDRTVELTGEAYFEVAHQTAGDGHGNIPFRVSVAAPPSSGRDRLLVEVLGTHFNIMAYPDESAIRTTLLQGAVKVSAGDHQSILRPGEQVALGAGGNWKLTKGVNIDETVDWKNGFFHFDHADLQVVMRQLARWYDVEVEYSDKIPQQVYQGTIKRDLTLAQLLENLGGKDFHFRIEGRKVVVTP